MLRFRSLVTSFVLVIGVVIGAASARAGQASITATAASPTTIRLDFGWWEDASDPTGHPEWVAFDLHRRASATCGAWTRINPDPFPRTPGVSQSLTFVDATPVPATMYEYAVHLVDASRNDVLFGPPECGSPCAPPAFGCCPEFSAPLVVGTVIDWGWAVFIQPCANGCWPAGYVNGPLDASLRPYIGTGQVVAIYGSTTCGTMEGCSIVPEHFTFTDCGPTPSRRATWGKLKTIYR